MVHFTVEVQIIVEVEPYQSKLACTSLKTQAHL
ncbi:hypothetical protein J2738_002853 [Variovorax paradoxus]|uniref:Uncharacterized protein n=1 Tax=Variovorax paradoxus TaxID=34073 RepID=A0AAE3XXY8_VARPD|nr:hypothetical protein [Variovorax paradoxus]